MYESFFGLADRPFSAAPIARRYFPAAAIENARGTLARCVDRAEGIGLAIGPPGTGKSMLCQVLAEQFRGRFDVALLASGRLASRRALFQAILFELGLPCRGLDEGELRHRLVDRLTVQDLPNAGLLLLVDEAHSMPLRMLEEVRLVMNLVRNGQPRVQLVLAGGPALEERLASPKLESFNQRIVARCYLQPFTRDETLAFVRHEITRAGGDADRIFAADALDAIRRATDGVPRLVNQLCDHALLLASAGGVKRLDAAGIEEAWADLQQLPAPWNASPRAAEMPADIIEFGSLDEPPQTAGAIEAKSNSAPRLRTVGAEDEFLADGEPVDRIRRIEEHLKTIDDGVRPTSTIVPEVELVFPAAENPFQESFAEEEVVIDRFSSRRADALSGAPLVRSSEGRELAAKLIPLPTVDRTDPALEPNAPPANDATAPADKPRMRAESEPGQTLHVVANDEVAPDDLGISAEKLSVVRRDENVEDEHPNDAASPDDWSIKLPQLADGSFDPADDPVMPEPAWPIAGAAAKLPDEAAQHEDVTPAVLPLLHEAAAASSENRAGESPPVPDASEPGVQESPHFPAEPNAEQVIIVEDDPPHPAPPRPAPPPPRRREYRQLFARLRRDDGPGDAP